MERGGNEIENQIEQIEHNMVQDKKRKKELHPNTQQCSKDMFFKRRFPSSCERREDQTLRGGWYSNSSYKPRAIHTGHLMYTWTQYKLCTISFHEHGLFLEQDDMSRSGTASMRVTQHDSGTMRREDKRGGRQMCEMM